MELMVLREKLLDIVDESAELEKLATGFQFTEGPVLRDGALWFTDFYRDQIFRYENGETTLVTDDSHRTIGMTLTRDGRLLGCASDLHGIMDVDTGDVIVDSIFGIRLSGTNDIVEHSSGRLYFTDPYVREFEGRKLGRSMVFCYENGNLSPLFFDLPWPNGLAFSPDERTLYVIDSREMRLYAVDMATNTRRLLTQFSKGMGAGLPDGMCVRADGTIFVAGPGGISVIDPDGTLLGRVKTPEICANLCLDETEGGLYLTASTSIYHLKLK